MPLAPYIEPKYLDQLLGLCIGQCNSAVAAGTTAQTTLNTRGSVGSGNIDTTPSANDILLFVTPGSGATQNQYTNHDVFLVTSATATSITFASRTVVAARAVGDFIFRIGTTTSFYTLVYHNTVYVGLSTVGAQTTIAAGSDGQVLPQGTITVASTTGFPTSGNIIINTSLGPQNVAYTNTTGTTFTGCTGGTGTLKTTDAVYSAPTQATILSNEPTATGSYARVSVINNVANFSASTGSLPATKVNGASISFPTSTAAWSSGATALDLFFVADVSTLAGGNVLAWGYLTNAQTVNASGITPSFAASALTATLL